jgi:hypothetical protein
MVLYISRPLGLINREPQHRSFAMNSPPTRNLFPSELMNSLHCSLLIAWLGDSRWLIWSNFHPSLRCLYLFLECASFHIWRVRDCYVFPNDRGWTCMDSPIQMVGSVFGIGGNFYIVSFPKMGCGHQEDFYFLCAEKYFDFVYALGQPFCIPPCYTECVNYYISLLSTVVRRFMSVLICSVCLDKIVSNRVKNSCIILINVCSCVLFAESFHVSILHLIACEYVIFGPPSDVWGAQEFRNFVLFSRYICKMNTCYWLRWCKSWSYNFLIYFAVLVAAGCNSPQCRHVTDCVLDSVHWSVLCDLPHLTHLGPVRSAPWCGSVEVCLTSVALKYIILLLVRRLNSDFNVL